MKSYWLWIAAAILMAVFITVIGLRMWLSGDGVRRLIEAHTGALLGGEATLPALHWEGTSAFGETFAFRGTQGSPVASIEARGIRGHWNWRSLFTGAWRLERVSLESVTVSLDHAPKTASQTLEEARKDRPAPLAAAFLPKHIELGVAQIQRADWTMGDTRVVGTALELKSEFGKWMATGTGGRLLLPDRPELEIETFHVQFEKNSHLLVDSSSLRTPKGGRISISGKWPGRLLVSGEDTPLEEVVGQPWKKFAAGLVSGHATVDSAGASGSVSVKDAHLRRVEWFHQLSLLLNLPTAGNMTFSRAEGTFETRNAAWRWTEIVLESEGLLKVEGEVSVSADRQIAGKLRIGIAAGVVDSLPGAREHVFQVMEGGYHWAPVSIGGTLDAPTEDLSPRLVVATGGALLDSVQPVLESVPEKAREAVGEALDSLFKILGR